MKPAVGLTLTLASFHHSVFNNTFSANHPVCMSFDHIILIPPPPTLPIVMKKFVLGRVGAYWNHHFFLSRLCPDIWTAQPIVTKLDVIVHRHGPKCCAQKCRCFLQGQGDTEGSYNQIWLLLSSELLLPLQPISLPPLQPKLSLVVDHYTEECLVENIWCLNSILDWGQDHNEHSEW